EIVAALGDDAGTRALVTSLAAGLAPQALDPPLGDEPALPQAITLSDGADLHNADVAIGDVQAGGAREIVFASVEEVVGLPDQADYAAAVFQFGQSRLVPIGASYADRLPAFAPCRAAGSRLDDVAMEIVAARPDADAFVVMNDRVLAWTDEGLKGRSVLDFEGRLNLCPGDGRFNVGKADFTAVAGDFDGQPGDEIAFAFATADRVILASTDGADGMTLLDADVAIAPFQPGTWPLLAAPDLDPDVRTYDFIDHTLTYSPPLVLGVLAAAPCYDAPWQVDDCSTSLGISEAHGVSESTTTTVKVGVSAGVNIEGGALTQSEFDFEGHVEASFAFSEGWSESVTLTVDYTGGAFEDTVVYTYVPYDVYRYTITGSPVPAEIGTEAVIAVPRTPVPTQAEFDFYNAVVAPQTPIARPFVHTIGDPTTYRRQAEAAALSQETVFGPAARAPQGGGSIGASIDFEREEVSGQAFGFSAGIELEATVASVSVGFTFDVESEKTLEVTVGSGMSYGGTVGGLDADHAGLAYDFGLAVRPAEGDHPYHIVDYWTAP
ncbi:MAG: hypothetical protein KC549_05370, partial [Myxococcales bacterium]|nr:hypothetical protein [Myxococcales bacterium]